MTRKRRTAHSPIDVEIIKARRSPSDESSNVLELRERDDGFVFPLNEKAEITAARFFCAAPVCPGYDYRASERPHPVESCGGILNAADDPAAIPEQIVEPIEDTPPLADDSPAANGEGLPEIPSDEPDTATHRIPALASEEEALIANADPDNPLPSPTDFLLPRMVEAPEDLAHFLVETSHLPLGMVPRVWTCWAERESQDPLHCYEVLGINLAEGYALCERHVVSTRSKEECLIALCHFTNWDLAPFLTVPNFTRYSIRKPVDSSRVYPVIQDADARGLCPCPELNAYIPRIDSTWLAETGDIVVVRDVDKRPYRDGATSPRVKVLNKSTHASSAVTVRRLPISEFLDHSLEYQGQSSVYDENLADPPIEEIPSPTVDDPRIDSDSNEPKEIGIFPLIQEIADELDVEFHHVTRLIDSCLCTILSALRLKGVASTSPVILAIQAFISQAGFIETVRKTFWRTMSAEEAPDLRHVVDYLNQEIEPRIDRLAANSTDLAMAETLASVLERLKLLEAVEHEGPPQPMTAKRKPGRPKGSTNAKRDPERPQGPMTVKRKPGRPKGSTNAKRATEGPPQPGTAKRKPGRPKGSTNAKRATEGPPQPGTAKRKPGRPKGSISPKKAGNLYPWDHFVEQPEIVKLLRQLAPSKVASFIAQAAKRLPDLGSTPWNSSQRGKFAAWYYAHPRAIAKR